MALVLSRKFGEEVVIGEPGPDQCTVKVLKWDKSRGRVLLGITAGKHMRVVRAEVRHKLHFDEADSKLPE